jgi:putative phosphoribosyl transferase
MRTPREDRSYVGERMFRDRADAGAKLATALGAYRRSHPLILGLPRGGVPVAYHVAQRLDADLDVIVVRKIAAPKQPELAIGAVAADGSSYINAKLRAWSGLSAPAFARVTEDARSEAQAREQRFRSGLPPVDPAGRLVIVVDDGLATGATMTAALRSLRRAGAENVVVAVPVGSSQACASIAREVDALICIFQPEPFHAVGEHYEHFEQCTDDEVQRLLLNQRRHRALSSHQDDPLAG